MSAIVNQMTKTFNMSKLGYDMMGYKFKTSKELSYHHLLIPRKECKAIGYGNGKFIWNGAILVRDTSHDYLHTIEQYDLEAFYTITSELFDEVVKGEISKENLIQIREVLLKFEENFKYEVNSSHHYIIREQFLTRRIPL